MRVTGWYPMKPRDSEWVGGGGGVDFFVDESIRTGTEVLALAAVAAYEGNGLVLDEAAYGLVVGGASTTSSMGMALYIQWLGGSSLPGEFKRMVINIILVDIESRERLTSLPGKFKRMVINILVDIESREQVIAIMRLDVERDEGCAIYRYQMCCTIN